jgi:hypothetical protein
MTRTPITNSSNIMAVSWCPITEDLEIEFKGGGVYRYARVPAMEHEAFIGAESLGRHFAAHIKGRYICRKVELLPVLVEGEPSHGEMAP